VALSRLAYSRAASAGAVIVGGRVRDLAVRGRVAERVALGVAQRDHRVVPEPESGPRVFEIELDEHPAPATSTRTEAARAS
jgi:hypothetical protein